jgi:hypothetical protein
VYVHEQAASPERSLIDGHVNGHRRARRHVFVVRVGGHADDPALDRLHVDELDHGVGPDHVAIDCVLVGEHALCQTLAHNYDLLFVFTVGIGKVASG